SRLRYVPLVVCAFSGGWVVPSSFFQFTEGPYANAQSASTQPAMVEDHRMPCCKADGMRLRVDRDGHLAALLAGVRPSSGSRGGELDRWNGSRRTLRLPLAKGGGHRASSENLHLLSSRVRDHSYRANRARDLGL